MAKIGGNTIAVMQIKASGSKNTIGESTQQWSDVIQLNGWLDLSSGDSKYTNYNAKIQESTHVFICDYLTFEETTPVTSENSRMLIDGKVYDIVLIDDPMNLHQQLEIYLKYVGGQNG